MGLHHRVRLLGDNSNAVHVLTLGCSDGLCWGDNSLLGCLTLTGAATGRYKTHKTTTPKSVGALYYLHSPTNTEEFENSGVCSLWWCDMSAASVCFEIGRRILDTHLARSCLSAVSPTSTSKETAQLKSLRKPILSFGALNAIVFLGF